MRGGGVGDVQVFGDPDAADLVFTCGARTRVIGLNITHQITLTGQPHKKLSSSLLNAVLLCVMKRLTFPSIVSRSRRIEFWMTSFEAADPFRCYV